MSSVQVAVHRPAELAESPLWDPGRRCLWWVDIPAGALHRYDPVGRTNQTQRFDVELGAVALSEDGALIVAADLGFAMLEGDSLRWLGTVEHGRRMNDGKVDPAGRFLAGTLVEEDHAGGAAFYQLQRGRVTQLFGGVTISNGLGWSPAGTTMYYIDTPTECVEAFDYDVDSGRLSNRRTLVDLHQTPGRPDGLTVDSAGGVWVAMARGGAAVRRFLPDGRADRVVALEVPNVTSLTFGGSELDELFVTTSRMGLGERVQAAYPLAGCVFRIAGLGVRGLPTNSYIH